MEEEITKKTDVVEESKTADETKATDVKTDETTKKTDETTPETKPEDNKGNPDENADNKNDNAAVNETKPEGNGIPLSEVALKSDVKVMIAEAVSALQSKLDSVLEENKDLKEKLAQANTETENVRKKYEDNGDFGTAQKKGAGLSEDNSSSGYVSYEDMWKGAKGFELTN